MFVCPHISSPWQTHVHVQSALYIRADSTSILVQLAKVDCCHLAIIFYMACLVLSLVEGEWEEMGRNDSKIQQLNTFPFLSYM